jgi:hypothetical protein
MANIVKPISTSDDLSTAEEWYLTVRCTNSACTRLIAFQKAISTVAIIQIYDLPSQVSRPLIVHIVGPGCVSALAR